jgi:hypothetical protein
MLAFRFVRRTPCIEERIVRHWATASGSVQILDQGAEPEVADVPADDRRDVLTFEKVLDTPELCFKSEARPSHAK